MGSGCGWFIYPVFGAVVVVFLTNEFIIPLSLHLIQTPSSCTINTSNISAPVIGIVAASGHNVNGAKH